MSSSSTRPAGINRRLAINLTDALIRRFHGRVRRRAPDECWEWTASFRNGYGVIKHEGSVLSAHRLAYVIAHGEPPSDKIVCHKCDNRACCNPAHLELGTPRSNNRDARARVKFHMTRGEDCPNAVLSEGDVERIWKLRKEGMRARKIAADLGLTESQVRRVIHKKSWLHLIPDWAQSEDQP